MKPAKQNETKIIIVFSVSDRATKSKKHKLHPTLLKTISIIAIALINSLFPETAIATFLIRLLFVLLEWLNQDNT